MKRKLLGPLVSIAVVILLDAAVGWIFLSDGVFRRNPVPPYDLEFPRARRTARFRPMVFDALLGWTTRTGLTSPDGRVHTNAEGARGQREYAKKKPKGVLRIGAFGDSYTFGDEVRDEDAWCHQLERSRDGLEVINFGVNAFGTDQAYLRYLRPTASFEFDIVLCGFMPLDALRNVNVYRPTYRHQSGRSTKPRFELRADGALELVANPARSPEHLRALLDSGDLLETLFEHDFWVRRAPAAYRGSALFASSFARILYSRFENRRDAEGLLQDPESEPFQVTLAIMREMAAVAASRGQRFWVVILPESVALEEGLRYWDPLVRALQESAIPVIDCTDALTNLARDGRLAMPREHYTPAGNAAVARLLAARIAAD